MLMSNYRIAQEAVQRAFGSARFLWDIEAIEDGAMVLVCDTGKRDGSHGACRAFSVHNYYPETGALYVGAYDLTMEEAMLVRDERAAELSARALRYR